MATTGKAFDAFAAMAAMVAAETAAAETADGAVGDEVLARDRRCRGAGGVMATVRIGRVEVGEFVSIPSVGARGQVTAITCDWSHWDRRLQRYAVSVQSEPEVEPVVWTLSGDRIAVVEA